MISFGSELPREERPGIRRRQIVFDNPLLGEFSWPICEIIGAEAGPRLCVSAGVHVNEVAAIEAAVRLQELFDPSLIRGSVEIIPLLNQPARYGYNEYLCPTDGKNINFCFPGKSEGTFSEALCHAISQDWTAGADCYIDLHGGDLREDVAKFTYYQVTGQTDFDEKARALASCFDGDMVVGLHPKLMNSPGRPPTGHARNGRIALMSEAGANGCIDDASVEFHVQGVLNVARRLGILGGRANERRRRGVQCFDYIYVTAPVDGEFHTACAVSEEVAEGQKLGEFRDLFGRTLAELRAPRSGLVLWQMTHPTLRRADTVLSIALPAA